MEEMLETPPAAAEFTLVPTTAPTATSNGCACAAAAEEGEGISEEALRRIALRRNE